METDKKKQRIKFWSAFSAMVIIIIVVIAIMIRYEVEGDKNMPFNLSKIVMVSTAEGLESEGKNKWNFKVYQNNDIYFYIDKNNNYRGNDTVIDSVSIENIQIIQPPKEGTIQAYMPNSTEGRLYSYEPEYLVENNTLTYHGGSKSNSQTLEIGSQGGSALIRLSNTGLGEYTSDKDKEIVHDGTLLKKLDLGTEDIQFQVSFDFIIAVTNCKYRANVILNFPCGNIMEEGTGSTEKTDMSDLIFKRVK